ncbi:fumarylacetoacetate hydrolase family protein [Leucobacter sp. UT-8R-CII-1-4]|uniref:fumarylacetoacetate hydrolase family protein n=1 Tax=Leucobacter sp. UT-8R-CII-1-4 TaxID=3040075 RepID=UPI0024A7DBAA|nr:fumarylacetoacetate hydrolase family protein [Leucobacter sp. UT-8R-CII-1-4]MDI6022604.1 fumarylacetoacetate hydrolase family protein [Leucobacter sp. UT-8R-CII-1-4]
MLDAAVHQQIAQELAEAARTRVPAARFVPRFEGMTVEDSYAVQRAWRDARVAAGGRVIGHKIGLTSRAMQVATGITEPDYGVIFADQAYESGVVLKHEEYTGARVEVELAFVLREDLSGPGVTTHDVLRATEFVVPALEILDSRIEMEGRTIVDTICDNAALGSMILGGTPVAPESIDLRWQGAMLYRNEVIEETGLSGGVLGHPAAGVAWLANRLAPHGERLEAGQVILSGSFTRPVWAEVGDVMHAEFHGMGAVTCRFV